MSGQPTRFDPGPFRWLGIEAQEYKPSGGAERGTGSSGVSRHVLASGEELEAAFDLRYFELAPGGYSSLEKHRHAHLVIALRGSGLALVDAELFELRPFDAVRVPPLVPHRFINEGKHPFGFLCPVDSERDRPQPLDDDEWARLRATPAIAQYVF